MTAPGLLLFDDRRARRWAPFTLTRPAGELLFGCLSLRERAELVLGARCAGHVTRAALAGFDEARAAPVVELDEGPHDAGRIFLSSRAVLEHQETDLPDEPARIEVAGQPAGWLVPPDAQPPPIEWLRDPDSAPRDGPALELEGELLEHPWHLVARNEARIGRDIDRLWQANDDPPGIVRLGDHGISLGEGAEIEAGVQVDLRAGPIRLAEGARVEGPARITGPLYLGPDSTILGGAVGTSSIGPVCLVRGEVAHSVLLAFVNKAHDGYLGHAILGRWVNLGAFTTNSDLKNNYGTVKVWTLDGDVDTGLLKVGCFLGDHVKTGIGTVLNTGTVVGAGSNVFGGVMPPTVVPPFSWGAGVDLRDHRLDKFLETADRVMRRRGREMPSGVRLLLERAWKDTAGRRAQ